VGSGSYPQEPPCMPDSELALLANTLERRDRVRTL